MNIIGEQIKHKTYGIGTVLKQDAFEAGEKPFEYPKAFMGFLIAVDEQVQSAILLEIAAERESKEAAEQAAQGWVQKENPQTAKEPPNQRLGHSRKALPRTSEILRIAGKRAIFYVFQGKTFDRESRGGYIWAPIYNASGSKCHHWERLLDVQKGDIIFHGCDGRIMAISIAKSACYNSVRPKELEEWDKEGRRVDCEYIILKNPIETAVFRSEIIELSTVKYSPFDRDGNGNMGYLYNLNPELAKVFIKGLLVRNPYLHGVDFVVELLGD
jgi:hypothetical protein